MIIDVTRPEPRCSIAQMMTDVSQGRRVPRVGSILISEGQGVTEGGGIIPAGGYWIVVNVRKPEILEGGDFFDIYLEKLGSLESDPVLLREYLEV